MCSSDLSLRRCWSALTIQADETANVLVVAARSDMLPLIEEIIKQLDIPAATGLNVVRIYPLLHAEPASVQKILNDLYASPRTAQLRPEEKPTITIDDRTQSLIVAGNEKTFTLIDTMLTSLDRQITVEMRDVKILPLEHGDAADLAATIQKLMDARVTQKAALGRAQAEGLRVMVIAEPRSNSLLVGGSKESFELVASLEIGRAHV